MNKERLQKEIKIRLITVLESKEESLEEVESRMELLDINKRLFFWFAMVLFVACFFMGAFSLVDIDWFVQRWVKAGIPIVLCGAIMIQGWHYIPRDYSQTNFKRILLTAKKMLNKEPEEKVKGYLKRQLTMKEQQIEDVSREAEDAVCSIKESWERWIRVAWFCIIVNGLCGLFAFWIPMVTYLWRGAEWVSLLLLVIPALVFWRVQHFRRREQVLYLLRLIR